MVDLNRLTRNNSTRLHAVLLHMYHTTLELVNKMASNTYMRAVFHSFVHLLRFRSACSSSKLSGGGHSRMLTVVCSMKGSAGRSAASCARSQSL